MALRASLGLSGALWRSLGLSGAFWGARLGSARLVSSKRLSSAGLNYLNFPQSYGNPELIGQSLVFLDWEKAFDKVDRKFNGRKTVSNDHVIT